MSHTKWGAQRLLCTPCLLLPQVLQKRYFCLTPEKVIEPPKQQRDELSLVSALVEEGVVEFAYITSVSIAITASQDPCAFVCELICELFGPVFLLLCSAV